MEHEFVPNADGTIVNWRTCKNCKVQSYMEEDGKLSGWAMIILRSFPDCDSVFVASVMDS